MEKYLTHLDCAAGDLLAQRCAQMGIALVSVDAKGAIQPIGRAGGNWLNDLVTRSHIFARALMRCVDQWEDGKPIEIWPGCLIVPLAVRARRRVVGYRLGVICSTDLLASEQFTRIIDAAKLDRIAATGKIQSQGLMPPPQAAGLAAALHWMACDLDQINQNSGEIQELSQQLAETYEELSLVYHLSARMTVNQPPEQFLREALEELQQTIGMRWFVMQLAENEPRLGSLQGKTFSSGDLPLLPSFMAQIMRRPLERTRPDDQATIITDVVQFGLPELQGLVQRTLYVPLTTETGVVGAMLGGDKANGSDLSSVDSKLVTSLAQNITIFLENSMLYDDLQDMFMGMLRSLVSAIDAKDAYTCGHSERVAWLGRELGRAAGLDDDTVERLYLSGMLHDVGKIGVPEAVLAKPGALTDEEFAIIKTHPRLGARIIEGVRQMKDLVPGVLYHHERFDGRGYPEGLSGRQIPLFGRVLCLADSFDAMSSTRTYREAMPLEKVLGEIQRCAGKQFDPELAELFVKLDFEPFAQMVGHHQVRESLLRRELGDR